MALTDKLTAIGNAIRSKTGGTEKLTLDAMPTEIEGIQTGGVIEALDITTNGTFTAPDGVDGYNPITVNVPQDGSPPDEAFVIKGNCDYRLANNGWTWFISTYGNRITTQNISSAKNMFYGYYKQNIPFAINFDISCNIDAEGMFSSCDGLRELPVFNNFKISSVYMMFSDCIRLRTIPEDFADSWDWSYLESQTTGYAGNQSYMFSGCSSLRSIPTNMIKSGNPNSVNSLSYLMGAFRGCYVLDELSSLPIPYTAKWNSNTFIQTFDYCYRLKNMTFALSDGQPYVMNWRKQTIDLTEHVGYADNEMSITEFNSGITSSKKVTDDATYQTLKDDPDWFTTKVEYSRYNHDSAVATINSLPDTSAYLATAGGTNTIKFKGAAGSATDGGAINTLTEEEIAVATAKGWTVTLS